MTKLRQFMVRHDPMLKNLVDLLLFASLIPAVIGSSLAYFWLTVNRTKADYSLVTFVVERVGRERLGSRTTVLLASGRIGTLSEELFGWEFYTNKRDWKSIPKGEEWSVRFNPSAPNTTYGGRNLRVLNPNELETSTARGVKAMLLAILPTSVLLLLRAWLRRDIRGHGVNSSKEEDAIAVWVAQGFGSGRLKLGPGTWGSLVGAVWFGGLVATGSLWSFFCGILLSIPFCVWICGLAEKALGEKDPGSVVLDEIIAVPVCFAAWVLSAVNSAGRMPDASYFFNGNNWLGIVGIFAAFRLFDIWKPWPVSQSQSLPGGWGMTVDDLLAALYVNLVSLPFLIG